MQPQLESESEHRDVKPLSDRSLTSQTMLTCYYTSTTTGPAPHSVSMTCRICRVWREAGGRGADDLFRSRVLCFRWFDFRLSPYSFLSLQHQAFLTRTLWPWGRCLFLGKQPETLSVDSDFFNLFISKKFGFIFIWQLTRRIESTLKCSSG